MHGSVIFFLSIQISKTNYEIIKTFDQYLLNILTISICIDREYLYDPFGLFICMII